MIRAARGGDCAAICALVRELAAYERLADQVVLEEERLRDHLFGPRPCAEALIAEDAGAAVGFALFFPTYSTFLGRPGMWLEDLYVQPPSRGKGHGAALLQAVARLALERGCGRLEWSVLDWNQPSIDFYKALGAVPLDDWVGFRLRGEALRKLAEAGR